ncbi:putative methanol O-anthraniloyltransferase-like [Abeliophyllum distichum]|uniref:Methanol O-anthraniloyltransferase-like n=1 Tax=Abeliophyllum distichum TaxID=126358 RepID=A0ABD1PN28_9LAMI
MAYAALRSLAQILHQTLNRDHQYLILDEKQQIESLVEKVSSIQDFLENSSQKIKQHLERKIRDASYIAEDIIESHITDRIRSESARFDLITGCLWKCRTIALNPADPDKMVRISIIINARGKQGMPDIPTGYYGNAFTYPAAVSKA